MLRSARGLGMQNACSIPGGADPGTGVNVPSRAPPACAGAKVQGRLRPAFGMCPGTRPHHDAHRKRGVWFSPSKLLLAAPVTQTKTLHWKKDLSLSATHRVTTTCVPPVCSGLGGALHSTAWWAGLQGMNIQTWSAESSFTEICSAFL